MIVGALSMLLCRGLNSAEIKDVMIGPGMALSAATRYSENVAGDSSYLVSA